MRKNTPNLTILNRLNKVMPQQTFDVVGAEKDKSMSLSALGNGINLGELGILRWVDVPNIEDSPWQTRDGYDDAHIGGIGESFDAQGILQVPPARIKPGLKPGEPEVIQLAAGHCRTEAVRRGHNAGSNLPDPERFQGKMLLWIRPLDDLQMAAIAVDENAERENPNLMEMARGYKNLHEELKKAGLADEATPWEIIAERAKVSKRRVFQIVALLKLPEYAQKKIAAGIWNEKHGRAILDTEPENRELLMRQIERKSASGNQAVTLASALRTTHKTQRDLDLGVAVEKAVKSAQKTGAKLAAQLNRAALEKGNSPLQLVKGGAPGATPLNPTQEAQKMAQEVASTKIPTQTSSTVASLPRLPQLVSDQLISAKTSLHNAGMGLSLLAISPDDLPDYEAKVAELEAEVKRARREINKQKDAQKAAR